MKYNDNYKKLAWSIGLLISTELLIQSSNNRYTFKILQEKPSDEISVIVKDKITREICYMNKVTTLKHAVLLIEANFNQEYLNDKE